MRTKKYTSIEEATQLAVKNWEFLTANGCGWINKESFVGGYAEGMFDWQKECLTLPSANIANRWNLHESAIYLTGCREELDYLKRVVSEWMRAHGMSEGSVGELLGKMEE